MALHDTIAAIATPPGRGGVGIVRISGPHLAPLLLLLIGRSVTPRRAVVADFRDTNGDAIDRGVVLWFVAPDSYTGEDVIELQGHGGPVIMQLLLQRCFDLGARPAEPGEFTKRAFLNNKVDLAQAESVADLINAATVEAARCAMRSLQGRFSHEVNMLVATLIELRARTEATLDFPEEEDVVAPEQTKIKSRLEEVQGALAKVLAAAHQGSLLREGVRIVLAGQPNVGKSSLLNQLAGENLAIVTDIPGTTRDAIRQTINIQGVPLHVVDTAGLRDPQDGIENIGISITYRESSKADVVLWISDASRPDTRVIPPEVAHIVPPDTIWIHVSNKIDLTGDAAQKRTINGAFEVGVSAKTGAGIDLLQNFLLEAIGWGHQRGEGIYMARARHLQALRQAGIHLEQAAAWVEQLELLAEELRLAQDALTGVTGKFTSDDLLGEIFSRFCVGK